MNKYISIVWAELLSFFYNGVIKYHHINEKGFWEFEILDNYYDCNVYYKTKNLK